MIFMAFVKSISEFLMVYWKQIACVIIIAGLCYLSYDYGGKSVQAEFDKHLAADTTAQAEAQSEALIKRTKAGEKYNDNQVTIDRLLTDSRRVRVNLRSCVSNSTTKNQDAKSREFQLLFDAAFEKLQTGLRNRIVKPAEELNNQAIRLNNSL